MEENLSRIVKIVLGIVIALILFTIILSATGVLRGTTDSLETKGKQINQKIESIDLDGIGGGGESTDVE